MGKHLVLPDDTATLYNGNYWRVSEPRRVSSEVFQTIAGQGDDQPGVAIKSIAYLCQGSRRDGACHLDDQTHSRHPPLRPLNRLVVDAQGETIGLIQRREDLPAAHGYVHE